VILPAEARAWAVTHGLRVLFVVLLVLLARLVLDRAIPLALRHSLVRESEDDLRAEQIKRAETLGHVVTRTSLAVLLVVAAFLVLAELGFSIAPVVAGLGITGIAVGLGAQTFVKDAINGLFILGENQFGRGDIITVANVTGRVVDISLRRTVLRAEDGTVYVVPNSAITVAANLTRGYSGIYIPISLSYQADLERATAEIDRIGQALAEDSDFGPLILEAPHVLRIDSLEDGYLNLRIAGRAASGAGPRVSGELRRRIKDGFDRASIAYRGAPSPSTSNERQEGRQ
jgi:moderate conductance mechanosensitive channel